MNTAQPIRNEKDLTCFREYYRKEKPDSRNYLMIAVGLNTALRISDILEMCWGDVYDFERRRYKTHLFLIEKKTGKKSLVLLNGNIREALIGQAEELRRRDRRLEAGDWIFENEKKPGNPISRVQAFRIVKKAARGCGLEGVISCHSLRKTFGYHAWKQGAEPALLMNIFNHSSYINTVRYLGIEQDDRDRIFRNIYR